MGPEFGSRVAVTSSFHSQATRKHSCLCTLNTKSVRPVVKNEGKEEVIKLGGGVCVCKGVRGVEMLREAGEITR